LGRLQTAQYYYFLADFENKIEVYQKSICLSEKSWLKVRILGFFSVTVKRSLTQPKRDNSASCSRRSRGQNKSNQRDKRLNHMLEHNGEEGHERESRREEDIGRR